MPVAPLQRSRKSTPDRPDLELPHQGDPIRPRGSHHVDMAALWIARIWEYDPEAKTIHVLITDGSDQRQFILERSENEALYDFVAAHLRD